MSAQPKPRQAASVILLRGAGRKGFEVFLIKEPNNTAFLGGMYCYPGGAVSTDDCAERMMRRCAGLTPEQARKIIGAQFSPRQALGLWVAAIRELFEEVGVLFAVKASAERHSMNPSERLRFAAKQQALLEASLSFVDLLESEDLYCDPSRLGFFSHWQTPAHTSVRFDTRFFVAALPLDQTPVSLSDEVAHSLWLTPEGAMQLHAHGKLPMIFPTFAALRTLADFETLESVLREFKIPAAIALAVGS